MRKDLITGALAVVVFTVLLGLAYPLAMTGVAQVAGLSGEGRHGDGSPVRVI